MILVKDHNADSLSGIEGIVKRLKITSIANSFMKTIYM
jgi:hypothetical protein